MKTTITALTAALLYGGALMTPAVAQSADRVEICGALGELAETIMTHRQNGTQRTLLLEALSETMDASDDPNIQSLADLSRQMIHTAYADTRWHGSERQHRAVEDFRDLVEGQCFDAEGGF